MKLRWVQKIRKQRLFLFLAISTLCGLAAASLAYYQSRPAANFSPAERLYDRDIRARIGPYAPYAFTNKAGAVGGYVMDLTFAVSRAMGVRIALRSRKLDDLSTIMAMQDTVAVLCLVNTPTTASVYDFSPPYAIHAFALFARKDAPAVRDHKTLLRRASFVINADGVYYDLYKSRFAGRSTGCVVVDSAEEAMRKLASGECQYTIMESYIGKEFLDEPGMRALEFRWETGENVEYSFAVRKGNPEVLRVFTEGLEYVQATGQFDSIQAQWVEKRFLISKHTRDSLILYVSTGFAVSLGIMIFFFLWSHILKRQVAERTSELEAEISERKKAQEQLLASQAQLMQADKMAAIGTMATGVAHEINNPNGLILLNFPLIKGLVEEYGAAAEARFQDQGDFEVVGVPYSVLRVKLGPLLEDMLHASLRIKAIVEDLKNFVRMDSTDSLDWREDFALNQVVQSAVRLLDNEIRKSTDHFHVRYGEHLPRVHGSSQKIEQVALNLVINACQALRGRHESIEIETGLDAARQEVFLRVRDEGAGIEPEHMSHLFDPFFTTKRKQGGTGLGLFISDKIIKAHHGCLNIRSLPGRGTVVLVTLPGIPSERTGSPA